LKRLGRKEAFMQDTQKTVPEQLGYLATGFAQIVAKMDKEKGEEGKERKGKREKN